MVGFQPRVLWAVQSRGRTVPPVLFLFVFPDCPVDYTRVVPDNFSCCCCCCLFNHPVFFFLQMFFVDVETWHQNANTRPDLRRDLLGGRSAEGEQNTRNCAHNRITKLSAAAAFEVGATLYNLFLILWACLRISTVRPLVGRKFFSSPQMDQVLVSRQHVYYS